jgi:steroid delta-isomerase-like uncharacterized protein
MSEENKAIARQFLRMFELGDASVVDAIIATDYYNHDAPDPAIGNAGIKAIVMSFKSAMPDARANVEFQVADGDKVVSRYTWSGTHEGEFQGVPATGNQVSWTATATFRIAEGKIREAWLNWDQWGLMQQFGAIPS